MMKSKILDTYNQLAQGYDEQVDHKPHNAYYDRPNMLRLIGDCKGKQVLDAGCGPGKYAQELISNGAFVTGFDMSSQMIGLAIKRNGGDGHFFVHDMEEPLSSIKDHTFDTVISALAMDYVEDWNKPLSEFNRVTRPGGRLVISMEHPFHKFNESESEQYFELEAVKCEWTGFGPTLDMYSYRRSLMDMVRPLAANRYFIDQIIEPRPVEQFRHLDPKNYEKLNRFPLFICISAVKRD
ncbi:class I SAM-dependent methyltransferase [Roseivirga sp.]|uniref:class I SAM-dependent methyltransferase n=1 Tax=Roseivirga sp. TaxID=1964215 RepID=UPI003B528C65